MPAYGRVRVTTEPWSWSDPRWRDRVSNDVRATYREALRRSVDLRDTLAKGGEHAANRAVFLVDVLNELGRVIDLEESDGKDLWTLP